MPVCMMRPNSVRHPCRVAIQFLGELDLPSTALHLVFCVGFQAGADDPVGFRFHRLCESGLPLRCLFLIGLSYDGNFVGGCGRGRGDGVQEVLDMRRESQLLQGKLRRLHRCQVWPRLLDLGWVTLRRLRDQRQEALATDQSVIGPRVNPC